LAAGNTTASSNDAQIDPALLPSISAADIPCHTPQYFTDEELTEEVFRPIWQRGEPIVVTGLLPKFKIKWTPEYFMEKYESQACLILECQSDLNKRITVGEFFSWFGKYDGRTECWKLKVKEPKSRAFRPTIDRSPSYRIGPRQLISRLLSRNCLKTLVVLYRFQTT
jgi:lysine-specific demethylase 3